MKVFIGADHNGFSLKARLVQYLNRAGYKVVDDGDQQLKADDDYPIFASKVVADMLASNDRQPMGILLCGSGQGMAIAANRHRGIRAAVCWDREQARLARNDDDCNILALPAYLLDKQPRLAESIVDTFLQTPFARATRFSRRIKLLDEL